MFKSGDIIVCIEDNNGVYTDYVSIKKNSIHKVEWVENFFLVIKVEAFYRFHSEYFINYNEWVALERDRKIKEILDEL